MKRLIFSNELKSKTLDSEYIKKFSSGGDAITGRGHCENEHEFSPHFLVSLNINPPMKEFDNYNEQIDNRLVLIEFEKKYVENPSNELELLKDENMELEFCNLDFKHCFAKIFIDEMTKYIQNGEYKVPEKMIQSKENIVEQKNDLIVIPKFLEDFEITNNENDFTKSDDIQIWLTDNEYKNISMKKFSLDLKRYTTINKYENVNVKIKKINRICVRCWIGIKKNNGNSPDNLCFIDDNDIIF